MEVARKLLSSILPLALRKYLRDKSELVRRALPGKPHGLPHLGLSATQIYPSGTNFDRVLLTAVHDKLRNVAITQNTRIASIGTCFAEEFAFYMLAQHFNYVRTEPAALSASANWGRVYTIPNLHQIVRYSIDRSFPLHAEKSAKGWFDPLREHDSAYSATRDDALKAVEAHRQASRRAFAEAELLIITVGQNEAWVDQRSEMVWARLPPREILEGVPPDTFSAREFGYAENCALLTGLINDLFALNPALRILLTVSPVPSHATFCDTDVVSQSFANKCLLRSVVRDVIAGFPDRVFYFPSFEMVMCYNPRSFRADNRHVRHATVDRIFRLLEKTAVKRTP